MRWTRTSITIVLLLSIWAICAAPGFAADEEAEDSLGRLSHFRLTGTDGQEFDSAKQLRDRGAVITFWRIDQEPSVRMLKDLNRLYADVSKQGIAIVSIVAGSVERSKVESAVKELEISFPVLFDPDRRVYGEFGGIVNPSTWFVDRNGVIVDAYPGHRRDFLRVARANLAFLRGQIDEAERVERISTVRQPLAEEAKDLAGVQTHYRLAIRLLEKGQREAAVTQLKMLWENDPPLVEAGVRIGLLLLDEHRDAEALKILERAVKLSPADPLASGARAVAMIRLGHEQVGAEQLRQALRQPIAEPLLYYEMARSSERSDATDEARRYYREGFELMLAERAAHRCN
jgi:peroxiredoxin